MSERIKELVEQAGFYITEKNGQALAEFAELIVKECFNKLTPYMDDQFIDDIESELLEHFGVEE